MTPPGRIGATPGPGAAGATLDAAAGSDPDRGAASTGGAQPQARRRWYEAVCAALVALMAIWELAMFPVKAYLITHLTLSTVITTDPVAEVGLGARAAFNHHRAVWLPWIWAVAVVSTLKWHVVAFWAGRLWGQDALAHWSGTSRRNQAVTRGIVWLATRAPALAILLAYLLAPVAALVYAALGAARLGWRRLLTLDLLGSAAATFAWIYVGFYVGKPAVHVLERYSRFATWVAIAVAALIVAVVVWRRVTRDTRRIKAEARQAARDEAARRIAETKAEKTADRRARREARIERFRRNYADDGPVLAESPGESIGETTGESAGDTDDQPGTR